MRRMYSKNQILSLMTYYIEHQDDFGDVLSTYIGDLISEAEISGSQITEPEEIDFTGVDLAAKTLSQSEANYDFDFASLLQAEDSESFEVVGVPFAHFKVINGCLHIVASVRFHNKAETQKSFRLGLISITLSESIASKIYDVNGKNASESGGGGFVRSIRIGYSDTSYSDMRLSTTDIANQVVLYHPSPKTILADDYIALSFEATLTII